jgi:hypothetical protein
MDMNDQTRQNMAQFLTAEHAALQAARSALVVEGNGRTASFLTTISAGMVALTLVFQISRFGEAFLLFALVLLPILGFVGLSTYVRMVQLDLADLAYTAAINRIRYFYLEIAPETTRYLSLPAFDDAGSVSRARVIYTSFAWTVVSYPSGLILVIDSLLAGAMAGLLATTLFGTELWPALGAGLAVFLLASLYQYHLAARWFAAVRQDFEPRFPRPGPPARTAAGTRAANEA